MRKRTWSGIEIPPGFISRADLAKLLDIEGTTYEYKKGKKPGHADKFYIKAHIQINKSYGNLQKNGSMNFIRKPLKKLISKF